jgi:hypothetical protein
MAGHRWREKRGREGWKAEADGEAEFLENRCGVTKVWHERRAIDDGGNCYSDPKNARCLGR